MCDFRGMGYDEEALVYLLDTYYVKGKLPLRACHPRDLIDEGHDIAQFLGLPRKMTRDLVDRACTVYFAEL
jgi:hypothetical protein